MYHFRLIIFCLILFPALSFASDSTAKRQSAYRNTMLLCFSYARHIPAGDLKARFGNSNTVGAGVVWKFGRNWQVSGGFNSIFSGQVKENGVLDSMAGSGGLLLDINGTYAEVRMYQRGYHWHVDFGKVIPLGSYHRNSGLLLTGGIGFMQHKIKFTFQRTVLPQLESDYYKGYDRLSNGFMLRGFAGYQHIDQKGMFSFMAGMEMMNGFTRNRRSFNYDTRTTDTRLRNDILLGLKAGIMITIGSRSSGVKKGEEERYFE